MPQPGCIRFASLSWMLSLGVHASLAGAVYSLRADGPAAADTTVAFSIVDVARPPATVPRPPPPAAVAPAEPPPPPPRRPQVRPRPSRPIEPAPVAALAPEPTPPPAGPPAASATEGASCPTLPEAAEGLAVGPSGQGGRGGDGPVGSTTHAAVAARPSRPTPRPEDVAWYLGVVRSRIEARKRYPIEARRGGVEGQVRIRIRIGPNGRLVDWRVLSSGSAMLRDAALEAVEAAAPFPVFPRSFGGVPIELVVPLDFILSG